MDASVCELSNESGLRTTELKVKLVQMIHTDEEISYRPRRVVEHEFMAAKVRVGSPIRIGASSAPVPDELV